MKMYLHLSIIFFLGFFHQTTAISIVVKRQNSERLYEITQESLPILSADLLKELSKIEPCSIPKESDATRYYPDYPQCRDGSCPPCSPIPNELLSYYLPDLFPKDSDSSVSNKPSNKPGYSSNTPGSNKPGYTIDDIVSEMNSIKEEIGNGDFGSQDEMNSTYSAQYSSYSGYNAYNQYNSGYNYNYNGYLPGYSNYPGLQTRCPQPVPNVEAPEICSTDTYDQEPLTPYMCPTPYPFSSNGPSFEFIKSLIQQSGYCKTSISTCPVSVSELILRVTLLEDKLRIVTKCETRLKIYTDIIAQMQIQVKENPLGKPGIPGAEGFIGTRGNRGARGKDGKCIGQEMVEPKPGPPGLQGPKGSPGPRGDRICDCDGDVGPPGFTGYSVPGLPGPKGHKGQRGARGKDHFAKE